MPRIDTGRGAESGSFTTDWAAFELVTWWKTDARPLGANVRPRPVTSWSVTCHIVESAAPGAANRPTDCGALPMVTPR